MACKSPNQWTPMAPRKSGEEQVSSDVEQGEELLDHVRQLIVDLLVDDSRVDCPAVHQEEQRDDRRDSKRQSNNREEDAAAKREQLLEEKLARTLLELAAEQDNLQLAASAGNTLLEQLRGAREEIDTLQDELEAAQATTEQCERDARRLRDQNAALENQLQRYVPFGSWEASGDQMSSRQSSRRGSMRDSLHRSFNDGGDSCELCASRETEVVQLEQRADEFRRRCLELELANERDQQRTRELSEEVTRLQLRSEDERLKTARVQHELDFVATQLDNLTEEVETARAARDTLRRTVRRLEAENEEICTRLSAREEHITKLENSKARTATQIQVAENRAASAQAETIRVSETLQQLEKQLENALLRQQHVNGQNGGTAKDDSETEAAPQEKVDRDMDQLLQDATREVTALRLENRILRRQSTSGASPDRNQLRGRRRKTMCTSSSPATTAAEVLALASREEQNEVTTTGSSYSVRDAKATSPAFQLPPLEISMETDATTISPPNGLMPIDVKKRRKMPLELTWVDNANTAKISTTKVGKDSRVTAPTQSSVPSVCSRIADEDTEHVQEDVSTPSPTVVTLSHHDHCVIGGATEVDTSDVHVYARPTRRSIFSSASELEQTRVRELPIEDIKKTAVEPPPQSPLVLGLSFIACATAATAAGLLVRR